MSNSNFYINYKKWSAKKAATLALSLVATASPQIADAIIINGDGGNGGFGGTGNARGLPLTNPANSKAITAAGGGGGGAGGGFGGGSGGGGSITYFNNLGTSFLNSGAGGVGGTNPSGATGGGLGGGGGAAAAYGYGYSDSVSSSPNSYVNIRSLAFGGNGGLGASGTGGAFGNGGGVVTGIGLDGMKAGSGPGNIAYFPYTSFAGESVASNSSAGFASTVPSTSGGYNGTTAYTGGAYPTYDGKLNYAMTGGNAGMSGVVASDKDGVFTPGAYTINDDFANGGGGGGGGGGGSSAYMHNTGTYFSLSFANASNGTLGLAGSAGILNVAGGLVNLSSGNTIKNGGDGGDGGGGAFPLAAAGITDPYEVNGGDGGGGGAGGTGEINIGAGGIFRLDLGSELLNGGESGAIGSPGSGGTVGGAGGAGATGTVNNDGILQVDGIFRNRDGTAGTGLGTLNLNAAGTLTGTGSLLHDGPGAGPWMLTNNGVIKPGDGDGTGNEALTIEADLTLSSSSIIEVEIVALSLTGVDPLQINGDLTLDIGTMIRPDTSLALTPGEIFDVIHFTGSLTGMGNFVIDNSLTPGINWQVNYLANKIQLETTVPIPEPGTYVILGSMLALPALRRRARA